MDRLDVTYWVGLAALIGGTTLAITLKHGADALPTTAWMYFTAWYMWFRES